MLAFRYEMTVCEGSMFSMAIVFGWKILLFSDNIPLQWFGEETFGEGVKILCPWIISQGLRFQSLAVCPLVPVSAIT